MSDTRNHDRWSRRNDKHPSWFRTLFTHRPIRQKGNLILRKLSRAYLSELEVHDPIPVRIKDAGFKGFP